jgi:hypothetical protein
MNDHDRKQLQEVKNMKTRIKAILGDYDRHTPNILHFTDCPTGKCQTGTNQNKGTYILKCANEQCNYKRKPHPIDIDLWKNSDEYRAVCDICPKCGNQLYLKPTGATNQ